MIAVRVSWESSLSERYKKLAVIESEPITLGHPLKAGWEQVPPGTEISQEGKVLQRAQVNMVL